MPMSVERFAATSSGAEALWAVVGDPARIPEWTDADRVEVIGDVQAGARVAIVMGERRTDWRLLTFTDRTWEIERQGRLGWVGLGARVVDEGERARLVLVGSLDPSASRWRARVVELPRMGAMLDRWATAAVDLA